MANRAIRHIGVAQLVSINKQVVSLTGEKHEYDEEDERRLKDLVDDVAKNFNDEALDEAILLKASLIAFRVAAGQHFREGNKRTALVAMSAFLRMNGQVIDVQDPGLVTSIDKAGIGNARLVDVENVLRRLISHE